MYIGYWAVLITGKYPRGLFNFQVGVQRWNASGSNVWFAGLVGPLSALQHELARTVAGEMKDRSLPC